MSFVRRCPSRAQNGRIKRAGTKNVSRYGCEFVKELGDKDSYGALANITSFEKGKETPGEIGSLGVRVRQERVTG
jgi:hypothetical protein